MKNNRNYSARTSLALITGLTVLAAGAQLEAQVSSGGSAINGSVISVQAQEITINAKNGPERVQLSDKTVIRGELPIKFSEITSGMYVGATAMKQPDGTFRAARTGRSLRRRKAA
jgi:hypothetical protein